ncbi:hypothetical protein Bbelb_087310 [Branchiostoma belcheri]|nr:hypothetical protein Bbelb_087310 [Branchiostoma belcheri]
MPPMAAVIDGLYLYKCMELYRGIAEGEGCTSNPHGGALQSSSMEVARAAPIGFYAGGVTVPGHAGTTFFTPRVVLTKTGKGTAAPCPIFENCRACKPSTLARKPSRDVLSNNKRTPRRAKCLAPAERTELSRWTYRTLPQNVSHSPGGRPALSRGKSRTASCTLPQNVPRKSMPCIAVLDGDPTSVEPSLRLAVLSWKVCAVSARPRVGSPDGRKPEGDPTRGRAGTDDDAEYAMLERTQQEKPPKDETPTQSQQTLKLQKEGEKEGREESVVTTTSRQTQGIPGDVKIKAQQRLQSDVTVQKQTPEIPLDVLEKAKKRLQGGVTEDQLGTAEHPRLSLWDFGGQATYYGSHQCFFTYRGIYILVMSLLQKLSDPVPDLDYKAAADNLVTGRDYLDHWLNSVRTHTLVHGREQTGEPRVVLVLTHKDRVDESNIEEYKKDIRDHISGKAAGKHVLPKIFVIDNFDEDNSDIDELREYLREVAKGLWFMGQEVPMTWLHLKSKLMDKRREDDPFCRFQDVVDLARSDDVGITDDSHVADILTFLHDLGDIIFINEPVLRDHVTLRPQVMIDVFKTIITVPEYQQDRRTDGGVAEMWRRLETEGILSDRLLTIIWTKADQKMQKPFLRRHKPFLKRLMEKYYLICNATPIGGFDDTSGDPEKEEIYFVPSLLATKPNDSTLYPWHMRRYLHPLYVVFDNMFLPSGMFYRLQAICVRRFGLQESQVFAGCGCFPTDDVKQQFVLTKVKHYLKIELLSAKAEDQPMFTQALPVRKFLSSCLFEIKEKWIPSIQYDWCFGEESEKETGTPVFYPLCDIEQETTTESNRFPEDFINVWIRGRSDTTTSCAENSGGSGPVMIEPTLNPADISTVHTIGPVLDCMETCRGLSLAQCDRIRHELTSVSRFKELVANVNRSGDLCRRLLGASVEVCLPERAPMFPREERGNEIVVLHAGDYNDKLTQPLLKQAVQSSSRYGITVSEDVIEPGEIITDKLLHHLLQRNVRMVVPIITPQTLHSRHWSTLGYEFCVQNKNLVFPVFAYPEGSRERLLEVLGRRCAGMLDMASTEVPMTEEKLSSSKISLTAAQILRKASSSVVLYTRQITAAGCTVVEDGVTIFFPKGCVKKKRFMSLEVDMLPIDGTMANSFSAVTPVMTVHLDTEEDFLKPVTVTLPWTWKNTCDLGRTILMKRSTDGHDEWTTLNTEVRETKDTITFTTCHFCSVVGAKKKDSPEEASTSADTYTSTEKQDEAANQEATEAIEVIVTRYSGDKAHLIISPNEATTDDKRIHLLCIEKGKNVKEYFTADNFKTPPPFRQEVTMHKKERIRARFGEEEDVTGDPRDIPPEPPGIQFVFPPANCNRISVRLKLRDPQIGKGKFEGAVHFTLLSQAGEPVRDPIRRINSAHVYLHSLQDEGKTSQVQQKEGTVITKASQIHHMKGGKRKAKTRHVVESSDSGPPVKRPKQGSARRPLVLLLNDEYGTRKGGISTVNRQIGCFLASKGAKVLCTVLNATQQDKDDAAADGIQLIFPTTFPRDRRKAEISWLTFDHQARYPDLPSHVDFIVGHVHITSHAARRIKERFPGAKLIQVTHVMPEETSQYKGDEKVLSIGQESLSILDDLRDADVLFSVGPLMYDYYRHQTNQLTLQHHELLPKPSDIFIDMKLKPPADTETKVVLSIGRVKGVERLKGVDLAATTMGKVMKELPHTKWRLRGIRRDDFQASRSIIEANTGRFQFVPFTPLEYGTQEELCEDMRKADVVLMPSRAEPFGLVGLEAIAAGVPVVISSKSGLAKFLKKQDPEFDRTIVDIEDDDEEAAKTLSKRIIKILKDGPREFKAAQSLKKKLLESEYWAESHSKLLQTFGLEG